MNLLDELKKKYPEAQAWSIGDSSDLANSLAELVKNGIKTASCGSLSSYKEEASPPRIGSCNIVLNGQGEPICVIRMTSLSLVRFSEVTEDFARKEGEGDLSLEYWRAEHKRFFTECGIYSEDMELVAEEFEVVEICDQTSHV
ncbi:ASCH domain-containing protein [Rosenbergiella collisarenosi]|uniref:ASCH domain-containing protein n=1 Tax=Rosenbergiella collisarenosi TaxID=1544695 RepID=UPI001F4F1210|nr:ASCH domain-containing protein [Rosenbergiella collisarenosi]